MTELKNKLLELTKEVDIQSQIIQDTSENVAPRTDLQTSRPSDERKNSSETIIDVEEDEEDDTDSAMSLPFNPKDAHPAFAIAISHAILCIFTPVALVVGLEYLCVAIFFGYNFRSKRPWAVSLLQTVKRNTYYVACISVCTVLLTVFICRYSFMIYTLMICIGSYSSNVAEITCDNFVEKTKVPMGYLKKIKKSMYGKTGTAYTKLSSKAPRFTEVRQDDKETQEDLEAQQKMVIDRETARIAGAAASSPKR